MTRIEQHVRFASREPMQRVKHRGSGFTLLELLVVVGILAALVALALPYYQDYLAQSKITAAQSELQMFCKALQLYDQQEATVFTGANLLPLIGKYLQDYRKNTAQTMPLDPWGNPYVIYPLSGAIQSSGPNGVDNNAGARIPAATIDDLVVTWKPGYYVTSIKAVNLTTVDVTFSRKASLPTSLTIGGNTSVTFQKINDYKYRFTVVALTTGTPYDGIVVGGNALDGAAPFDINPFFDASSATGQGDRRRFTP